MRPTLRPRFASILALPTLLLVAAATPAQGTLQTHAGSAWGGQFGSAVAFLDDLNSDGVHEILVGAPDDDTVALDAGAAFVLHGATGVVLRTHYGANAGDRLGAAVAFAHDHWWLGDGVNDYAIGIPFADAGGANAGQVQIRSGATGSLLSTMNGAAAGDRFGSAFASLGTIDDGTTTGTALAIGAPYADAPGAADAGGFFLRFSNGTTPAAPLATHLGSQAGEHLGSSIHYASFFFGFLGRFAVGAPDYDSLFAGVDAGRFEAWDIDYDSGTQTTTLELEGSVAGTSAGQRLGTSVAVLHQEGSERYAAGGPGGATPSVLVFETQWQASPLLVATLTGTGGFGSSIAAGNPLSFAEYLAVGSPDFEIGGVPKGRVTIFVNGTAVQTLDGAHANGRFGATLASESGADYDSPLDRFAVAAPGADIAGVDDGWVEVRTPPSPYDSVIARSQPQAIGAQAGRSVAGLPDVNGDGVPDFLVGAPADSVTLGIPFPIEFVRCGSARVISGATGAVLRTHLGPSSGDELGWSVANIGDANGDGVADYAVGAPQRLNASNTKGYARVYSGATGALLFTVSGVINGGEFGFAVGGGSDFNGDGRRDLLVGAPGTTNGIVYIWSGATGLLLGGMAGENAGDRFGASVAGLGADVSGDGVHDWVAGAPNFDFFGNADAGRTYLMRSHTSLLFKWGVNGVAAGDRCGTSVANAGDLNGDGTVDFVVGLPGYDFPASNAGRARVFSGAGALPVQIGDAFGNGTNDSLGTSVAGVGDLDLDGHADWAAGAPEQSGLPIGDGYVKVLSGVGSELLFTARGDSESGFGHAIAPIGDADADGLPDLVVGEPADFANGDESGAATLVSLRPAGIEHYGSVPPGCAGPQRLAAHGVPSVGNALFALRCNRAPASSLGLLLVTDSKDPSPTGTDVFGIGAQLLVDFFAATEVLGLDMNSDALGFGATPTPVPANAALVGKTYFAQALWAWGAACPLPPYGLSTSSGVALTIQ